MEQNYGPGSERPAKALDEGVRCWTGVVAGIAVPQHYFQLQVPRHQKQCRTYPTKRRAQILHFSGGKNGTDLRQAPQKFLLEAAPGDECQASMFETMNSDCVAGVAELANDIGMVPDIPTE